MNTRPFFIFLGALAFFRCLPLHAQPTDTLSTRQIQTVTIRGYQLPFEEIQQLESVHRTYILSGKKHEVIAVQNMAANLAEKTGRQIFAKMPGAFVYDMDGSGNQVNIATRGLDPHRSWEYNVRQNGVLTNSDLYAYPASHYSPPMEAIQRIEVVRGTASLQYGAQFGGMLNYVLKQADTTRPFQVETIHSVGSFGLLSTYLAVGGKQGRWSYYGYYHRRVADGYRQYTHSDAQGQYGAIQYNFSPNLSVKAELGRSEYCYRVPGPLTDAQFAENPRQGTRQRNYFQPDVYLPSLSLSWKVGTRTQVQWVSSALLGARSSVQFIGFADTPDTVQASTRQYRPRQVDIDNFHSYASEGRVQHDYRFGKLHNTVVVGLRYTHNNLHRRQQGQGTTGMDFDLTLTKPTFGRNVWLKTENTAFFAENLFRLTPKLEVSTGVRVERGTSRMSGSIVYLPDERVPQAIHHHYPLFGASAQYQLNATNRLYGGWSQAYRPVIFADMIPATVLERTDPNLQDAFGYNAEVGIKGKLWGRLAYDASLFQMQYNNRIGTLVMKDDSGQSYIWKTNIGDSRTRGLELYTEGTIAETNRYKISVFTASAYFAGVYRNGRLRMGNENVDLTGKHLETVPPLISRNGLQMAYKQLSSVVQYSYVAASYSDALNTETPSANGAVGKVPAYGLWDWNVLYRIGARWTLRASLNNLTNTQYFTKRPTGYPGQGVWSSDGRSVVLSVGVRI